MVCAKSAHSLKGTKRIPDLNSLEKMSAKDLAAFKISRFEYEEASSYGIFDLKVTTTDS